MSFNTPREDTSPRDMAERCLGIGYDCTYGVDGWNTSPGRDAVSRPRQYRYFTGTLGEAGV